MSSLAFDALSYFEELKDVGVPEKQARVLAEGMRAQSEAIHSAIKTYDEARQKELGAQLQETRLVLENDLQKTRLVLEKEIQKTRMTLEKEIQDTRQELQDTRLALEKEIQEVRLEVEKVRAELKVEIRNTEARLLKWQIGIALAIIAVMAKGFNWLGF